MRALGNLAEERDAYRLYNFLKKEKIDCVYDKEADGHFHFWVMEEDQFDAALSHYEMFVNDPRSSHFDAEEAPPPVEEQVEEILDAARIEQIKQRIDKQQSFGRSYAPWTRLIIAICVFLFLLTLYQKARTEDDAAQVAFPPVEQALLFDYPSAFEEGGHTLIWPGIYAIALDWPESRMELKAPLFEKIGQGQVWRLITPVFLHAGILHILFNMLWLWLLGKQVEERAGAMRYLLLSLIVGIVSNCAQYYMSGFSFIGYSGIICGLAGYIWIRQRVAPWEGYPLQKGTAFFLMIFVLGVAALQTLSFLASLVGMISWTLPFANTAHVVGALVGMGLARIPMFSK